MIFLRLIRHPDGCSLIFLLIIKRHQRDLESVFRDLHDILIITHQLFHDLILCRFIIQFRKSLFGIFIGIQEFSVKIHHRKAVFDRLQDIVFCHLHGVK